MSYRKFKADHLFTGFTLLDDVILITKKDGEIVSITDQADAGDDVEVYNGILTPGFINTHCHLELSHLKGLVPERTGLIDFVYRIINERHFPEDEILASISKAEAEMFKNGTVAVGDICNNSLTVSQKLHSNLAYYNFVEASGWLPSLSQVRWQRSKEIYDLFAQNQFAASIVPHAPYSVSDDLWRRLSVFFENKAVSIHNQESVFEDELFLQGTGDFVRMYEMLNIDNSFFSPSRKTSVQTYFDRLAGAASVIFVHNTYMSQPDIDFIKENKPVQQSVSFCLCPNANLYIENKLPPVKMLVDNSCNITLGTDSLASNHSLNVLEEMKTIQQGFPFISTEEMLGWATINGARALQMQDAFGSFEVGKKPGIVLIENVEGQTLNKRSTSIRVL